MFRNVAATLFWTFVSPPNLARGTRSTIRMKSTPEIVAPLHDLFRRRRKYEPLDHARLSREKCADLCAAWRDDFIKYRHPALGEYSARWGSIFENHLTKMYGDKCFVFALLQMGVSWHPSQAVLQNTSTEGIEMHVSTSFASWLQRLVHAIKQEKNVRAPLTRRRLAKRKSRALSLS